MAEKKSWRNYSKNYTEDESTDNSTSSKKTGSWRDYSKSFSSDNGDTSNTSAIDWRNYADNDTASIVGENLTNRVNTWLENHNNYITNYQTRNSGRKFNYEDSYVSDSADWLNTISQQKSAFDTEADSILAQLDQYKGYFNDEWVESVKNTLTDARSAQDIILENSTKDNEWWNSFNNEELVNAFGSAEDAYKYYQRSDGYRQKYAGQKYDDIQKALSTLEDGEEKDWLTNNQYEFYKDDTTYNSKSRSGWKSFEAQKIAEWKEEESKTWFDKALESFAATPADTSLPNAGLINAQVAYTNDTTYREPNEKWSADQRNQFGYLWATDRDKAYEYAVQVNSQIADYEEYLAQQGAQQDATKNGWTMTGHTIGAIASAPLALGDLLGDLVEYSARGTITSDGMLSPFEYSQAVQSGIANKLNKVDENGVAQSVLPDWVPIVGGKGWGDVYSLGVSAANSLVSAYTLGGVGTLVNFIGQGGASGVDEALSRGASPGQALLYGAIVGAAEGATEMLSADKLIKVGSASTLKNYLLKALGQGVGEFAEEGVSSVIGNIADNIIMQDKSNFYDTVEQIMDKNPGMSEEEAKTKAWLDMFGDIAFDALGGFVTGATNAMTVGGVNTAVDAWKGNQENIDAVKKYGGNTDALIQEGLQNDKKSDSYKLAEKYRQQIVGTEKKAGKAMTGFQIRNLLAANQSEVTKADLEKIQDAAANRLAQVGQREDIYKIAELATKYATGQEMTRAERSTLARSSFGSQVASELLDGIHPDKLLSKWENDMSEESGAEYSTDWTGEIGTESDKFLRYNNEKLVRTILEKMASTEDPATYKSLESRMEAEEPAQVSDTGKSVIRGTEQEVDLAKPTFKEITEDGAVLEANGESVNANNIDYADENLGYAIRSVGKIENITPEAAGAVVSLVDMSKPVVAQMNAMDEAFSYGYNNYSVEDLKAGLFTKNLTDAQLNDAYKLGQYVRGKTVVDADAPVVKMRTALDAKLTAEQKTAQQKARFKGDAEVYFMDGSNVVKFDESGVQLDESNERDQRILAGVNTAKFLSKLGIGGKYYFYQSYLKGNTRYYKDANGVEKPAPNGFYTAEDGSIYIDLNAGNEGQGTALFTLGHELTHFVKAQSKKQFKILADLVKEAFDKTDMSMHKRVLAKQKFLENARNGEAVSYDEAYEEVVADAMSTMLTDGSLHEKLMEIKVKDKGLFNTIKRFFEKMIAKFREVYAELTPDQRDARDIREMKDMFDKIQTAFAEALVEASDNFQASITASESQTLAEAGIGFDEETKSAYSLRYSTAYKDTIQVGKKSFDTEAIAQIVAKGTNRSIDDARKWVKSEMAIANIVMQNPEFLDFEADNRYEAIKKNSDYPQGTVDLSNLCPKREEFTAMFDMLQKEYPNKLFTAQDIADMRKILAKNDITVACGACFVEDRRQLIGEIADTFIGMWREAVETGKPLQKTNAAGQKSDLLVTKALAKQYGLAAGAKIMATDTYIPNQYDLTTYEGFKLLEKNHPTIAMGFNRYNNSRGQQSARLIEGRSEYNRQILGWSDAKVRSVNNNGGLRIFSFSDFEVVHLLDLVQVIIDCSARGVKIQGYTKIPAFAKLVRDTGIKLNRSLIPKGDYGFHMENGKVVLDYDTTEGIDIHDENFLDESDNPNVGNIVIGINPTQIGAAMLDSFVDYIIPFHSNKAKEILKKLGTGEWVNYKESQHEKDISTGKASKHNVNIYTEVINKYHPKNKVEFVEAFLKECKRQGKIPRYAEFLNVDANGDYAYREGYHKLLVDFKMFDKDGNILPQGNITPNLNEGFMKELLNAEVDKKQNYKFPQGVYDDINKKFGEKHSDRGISVDTSQEVTYHKGKTVEQEAKGNETREESREAFHARASKTLPEVDERGSLAFGFRRYSGQLSQNIREAEEGLKNLGIPVVIFEQLEANREGVTTIYQNDGATIPGLMVFIHHDTTMDAAEIVAHEGYHYLATTDIRFDYAEVLADNVDFPAKAFTEYQQKYVDEKYFPEAVEVGSPGWAAFMEEVFAYITGHVHAGDPKGEVHKFIRDYDAVKAALDDLLKKQASSGVRNSDRDYLDAVNRGDMETAQRMVDEAAKAAGYSVKAYHGTPQKGITSFDAKKIGTTTDDGIFGRGFYFSTHRKTADNYATPSGETMSVFIALSNPWWANAHKSIEEVAHSLEMSETSLTTRKGGISTVVAPILSQSAQFTGHLVEKGYDSVVVQHGKNNYEIVLFDNKRIKSADPVTYDDDGNVIPLSKRFKQENDDIRYSERDSTGAQLSKEQQEFFKDSKVRDKKGNLLVVYHGTTANFNTFKKGDVGFHFGTKGAARGRAGYGKNVTIKEVYLNITNPVVFDEDLGSWDADYRLTRELYDRGILTHDEAMSVLRTDDGRYKRSTESANKKLASVLMAKGYDGIAYQNTFETKKATTSYIAFASNQAKEITNVNPTSNPDIRYSERINTEGMSAEAKKIISNLKLRASFSRISKGEYASYSAERIERELDRSSSATQMDYAKSYIAWVNPIDFLYATTTSDAGRAQIEKEAGELDLERLRKQTQPIHLTVDFDTGKIVGHEGRHRMIALHKAGVEKVAVIFDAWNDDRYNTKPVDMMMIGGQEFGRYSSGLDFFVHDMLPLSKRYADATRKLFSEVDGSIKFSERGDGTSNRHLLANAFEGISKSSIEYSMIQEYKGHIEELNKLDEKLSDINQKINKMLFDKETPRDSKKLKELQDEAKEVAKEINRYDKRLLNMEASEPLRKVIERERKKEAQKTKDHVKEIQENKKVRAEQTELRHKIRKTVRDLDKLLNRGNKKLNVKEDMKGFVSKALELADYLFTDHISNDELLRRGITVRMTPKEAALVKETEDILSQLYDNADSLTDEEFTRLDAKRKANEEKLRDLLKAQRNDRLNTPVYDLFNDLVTEYASLKNSKQDSVKAAYDEVLENSLRAFMVDEDRVRILKNMRVADMTTEELNWLYRAYTMVLTNVRNANKFHVKGITETIEQRVGRIASDFTSRKIPDKKAAIIARNLANKIGWDYEKLYYALDRIGSEAFTELVMNIANSENTVMQDVMEAAAFRDEMVEKYGFNNWDVNKEIDREFLDNTGKKFKLTLGQLMALYAYSRREGAWDHIEYGGFVFGEAALTNPRPADSYKLSKEQCEAITSLLTEKQRGYAEAMQKYLSETMGEKGNEVSMMLYGIKMFGEKNYFPIHIAGQFKAQANESQAKAAAGFSSMSNAGFTHAQNPNAKAPFVLEGFNEIWTDHVNEMSRYHGTVPALEDLRRVMNRSTYSDSVAESQSIKQLMENSYGKEAVEYFDNLYREANSGAITDKLQKNSKKLLSLFRKNSVAYSLSVLIQQPASLVRAYSMIDKKYFGFKGFGAVTSGVAKAVSSKWNPAYANAYNEMLKYAPGVTMAKEIGGFDTATGGSIRSYLLDTGKTLKQKWNTGTALEKGKAVLDVVDDNAIANLPNVADKIAWIEIWNACKREAVARNKNLKPGSDEFMQTVGERFTEVIRATQVYDSIFAKSPMLKSKNLAVQYLVSFMNEPNTVANMVEKAVRDATKGDWKSGAKTAAVVVHSIIFTNVLKSLVYAMRDEDEDETYIEKYIEAVAGNMMSDFNALNYIPIARDAWSLAQGYDVERADMAIVADALDALNRVIKNGFTETEDMTEEQIVEFDKKCTEANWKLVESVAAFFGIPVKNIRREIEGVINTAKNTAGNNGQTTLLSAWEKVYDAVIESIPFMQVKNTKQDKLYEAIMAGDQAYLSRLKSTYKDDSAYQSAVRKALRENDSRIHDAAQAKYEGRTEEYKRIFREIQKEGKFSFDDIMSAVNSEESAIRNKLEPDKATSSYTASDFVESIVLGDSKSAEAMKEDIIATKVANGKTQAEAEKEFISSVATGIRDAYSSGLLDEAGAEKMLMEYADKDEEEAASKVGYWGFCEDNPKYDYFTESNVKDYREFAEPENISLEVYAQFINGTKGLADIKDKWGDVEVTKREQVLEVIDSLPLTWQQKDALYLAAGYSESKIWDVPW